MKPPLYFCRNGLNIRSGAGQMIASQARFFSSHGYAVTVCCNNLSRGSLDPFGDVKVVHHSKLWGLVASKSRRQRALADSLHRLRASARGILIDHEPCSESADISYVHNFLAPEHVARLDANPMRQRNLAGIWEKTSARHLIVANSAMVKKGLMHQFGLPDERIEVIYPGYDPKRFSLSVRDQYRELTRRRLGVALGAPLIGLVMSGGAYKRGVDRFLDCIERLRTVDSNLRGLVLGARRCPDELKDHPLYRTGDVIYEQSTFVPEQYFAALDVLLLPARYEEFGIVVLESMAMGVPVVTSSAVGASELVRRVSGQTVIDAVDDNIDEYCKRTAQLLRIESTERAESRQALSQEARKHVHEAHNNQLARRVDGIAEQEGRWILQVTPGVSGLLSR